LGSKINRDGTKIRGRKALRPYRWMDRWKDEAIILGDAVKQFPTIANKQKSKFSTKILVGAQGFAP